MDIAMIVTGVVLLGMIVSCGYVFVKISERYGLAKGLVSLMILVDIYAVILMILGIDRALFQIRFARLGTSITVTALTIFLLLKIPLTIYIVMKSRQLQQVLG